MLRYFAVIALVSGSMLASAAADAYAHQRRHHRGPILHEPYGAVVLTKGYSRRGPASGYRFGFATYRGDPFARDDYYDGQSCYYLHRHDFCLDFRKPLGLPH